MMFAYELHQARQNELQRRAAKWRLARDAKAARTSERRAARRTGSRRTARTGEGAEGAPSPCSSPEPSRGGVLGLLHRGPRPHGAV